MWERYDEEVASLADNSLITANGLLEQINVTRDTSDYLWYITRWWLAKFSFSAVGTTNILESFIAVKVWCWDWSRRLGNLFSRATHLGMKYFSTLPMMTSVDQRLILIYLASSYCICTLHIWFTWSASPLHVWYPGSPTDRETPVAKWTIKLHVFELIISFIVVVVAL